MKKKDSASSEHKMHRNYTDYRDCARQHRLTRKYIARDCYLYINYRCIWRHLEYIISIHLASPFHLLFLFYHTELRYWTESNTFSSLMEPNFNVVHEYGGNFIRRGNIENLLMPFNELTSNTRHGNVISDFRTIKLFNATTINIFSNNK